jgi:pilus assembly protein Flp/PilA
MTKSDTFFSAAGRELARFRADESGATAIEYALIASGIGAVIAATVYSLGDVVKASYASVAAIFP